MSDRRTILILSANPKGTNPLRLGEEIREIKEGLKRSKYRELFQIETAEAVRVRDVQRAMLDYEPNIVHFSGHGAGEEGLVFEDEMGQVKLVSAEALADLFSLFADKLDCVLLNACYSEVQAQAVSQQINSVIGMSQAIGDKAAIAFAVGFYDALGADKGVDFAYKLGCNAIQMQGIPEHLTPKLLTKNNTTKPEKTMTSQRVFISYRSQEPDVSLAQEFHDRLQAAGHTAFMAAKSISWGENWIERIDQELKQCDYFLLLLSEQSASSDMVAGEVRTARGLRDKVGKPIILPIRVNLPIDDPLNYELRSVLQTIQQKSWRSPDDTPVLVQEILSLMAAGAAPEPVTLESPVQGTDPVLTAMNPLKLSGSKQDVSIPPILINSVEFLFGEGSKIIYEIQERRELNQEIKTEKKQNTSSNLGEAISSKNTALKSYFREDFWSDLEPRVKQLLSLTNIHKKNYYLFQKQLALFGGEAFAPPITVNSLTQAEDEIIKNIKELIEILSKVYDKQIII